VYSEDLTSIVVPEAFVGLRVIGKADHPLDVQSDSQHDVVHVHLSARWPRPGLQYHLKAPPAANNSYDNSSVNRLQKHVCQVESHPHQRLNVSHSLKSRACSVTTAATVQTGETQFQCMQHMLQQVSEGHLKTVPDDFNPVKEGTFTREPCPQGAYLMFAVMKAGAVPFLIRRQYIELVSALNMVRWPGR